jgi:hypothetical protein
MKRYLLLLCSIVALHSQSFSQASHPYLNCPNVNIAIVRAGTNADVTNPYYLYNVNQATGAMALVPGGPYKDPANPALNLQINAIGVSKKDGYIYGLVFDGTTTTARFVRADSTYGVTDLGAIPSPASGTGLIGIVNPAAGDMDTAGNYYFSAFTINPLPTPTFDKYYIGRISNTQLMTSGPPLVQYFEVDVSGANCSNYISSLLTDPNNSGLKDFSYSARTNSFYTYATYKMPGASTFSGQLLQLVPITGSSPLRYQLVCNAVVNTHTAETSGTIIDMNGGFTVLFTDGSFSRMDTTSAGVYTGTITTVNTSTGLPNPERGDMGSCGQGIFSQQAPPAPGCPANFAVVRAGTNANITNPYYIYSVDGNTGAMTLLPGGPLYYTGTTQTVQMNGVGMNSGDMHLYGMAYEGSLNTARFVKTDLNYHVTAMGNITAPLNSNGTPGFVNSAAGDIDGNGNYYFTAVTVKSGHAPGSIVIDKLWLGKISNVSAVTGTPVPTWYEVDWQGSQCTDFINSLNNDLVNSGVKDLFYHPVTRTFFSYVTYKLPGDINYRGQMVELKPIGNPNSPNSYKLFCKNVMNTHVGETSGTMVTDDGKFMILLTDGTVGYIPRTGNSYNYSGQYIMLNNATGLPNPLRGDLAACTNLHHPSEGAQNSDQPLFTIHPNPVIGGQNIILTWRETGSDAVSVMIYDSYGVLIRTISNAVPLQGEQLSIPTGSLTAGIYYVKVTGSDGSTSIVKFVKAN